MWETITMERVGSLERSRNYLQYVGVSSSEDERQFKMYHEEMPTENWKHLNECFRERLKIEWELHELKKEKKKWVAKGDELQKRLSEAQRMPVHSKEDLIKKQETIRWIKGEIMKVNEEIKRIRQEIKKKKQEFYRAWDKVEEAKKNVIEDEHKQNQLEDEQYRKEKEEMAKEKIWLLMAA